MPYIVVVVDEMSDLYACCWQKWKLYSKLSQMARAAGIHYHGNSKTKCYVITGTIKANFQQEYLFK